MVIGTLALFCHAQAQDEAYPVDLNVGETFDACATGVVVCPVRGPICDDLKVAVPSDAPGGFGWKAVGPGTTLCSVTSGVGPRRIFRITVYEGKPQAPDPQK
jgi:hypothetical protein